MLEFIVSCIKARPDARLMKRQMELQAMLVPRQRETAEQLSPTERQRFAAELADINRQLASRK